MTIIASPGVDFHADTRGPHPGTVFLHGFGDDLHAWDSLWGALDDSLGNQFAALRYDLRGFGASVCRTDAFRHADDLLAVLDAMAIDRCDLIGVSMGASIALNFTLDHPQRVSNLVLISPNLVAWDWSPSWRQYWQRIVDHARAGAMDEARRLWWEHPLFETTRASAAGPALFESIMRFAGEQWIEDHHELMLPDVERLHLLATRTLLMTGGRDLGDYRLIADLIEGSVQLQRVDYPKRGHLLHLEDPTACAADISAFLFGGNESIGR